VRPQVLMPPLTAFRGMEAARSSPERSFLSVFITIACGAI